MKITKIKHTIKDDKPVTLIRWEEPTEKGVDKHEVVSNDPPHPDFLEALQALRRVVVDACMLHNVLHQGDGASSGVGPHVIYDLSELTVIGVSLKEKDDGSGGEMLGVSITALRELDWTETPLVLNTPFAPVGLIPSDDTWRLIETLLDEAEAYVEGKRAQASLFGVARELVDMGVTVTRGAEA